MSLELRSFPRKVDRHIGVSDDLDQRRQEYLTCVVPVMRAVAEEIVERWLFVRESVGGVDGMLLAAQTIDDLADQLVLHVQAEGAVS